MRAPTAFRPSTLSRGKLTSNGGETVQAFIAGLKETVREVKASNEPAFGHMGERMEASVATLEETTAWLQRQLAENKDAALSGATPFGRLFGLRRGRGFAREGRACRRAGCGWRGAGALAFEARHFAESLMCATEGLKHAVTHSSRPCCRPIQFWERDNMSELVEIAVQGAVQTVRHPGRKEECADGEMYKTLAEALGQASGRWHRRHRDPGPARRVLRRQRRGGLPRGRPAAIRALSPGMKFLRALAERRSR